MNPTKTEPLDRIFLHVQKGEERALRAVRDFARSARESLPVEMPLMRALTDEFLDFTEELLRIYREFAHDVLVEASAVLDHLAEEGRGARPAPRAQRSTTRKPAHPRAAKSAA